MKKGFITNKIGTFVLAVLASSCTWFPAHAGVIKYTASDLADVTPGEDLWRYDYTVSGHAFVQSEFFDIYFVPSLYANLMSATGPNTDWDVAILQQPKPDNLPPFDTGIFDFFALLDNPSLTGTFSVTFTYLGAGSPGAQPFEFFGADSALLQSGETSKPVSGIPEPSSVALALVGLAALVSGFHRTSKLRARISDQ